jgi:hypothetical protein
VICSLSMSPTPALPVETLRAAAKPQTKTTT